MIFLEIILFFWGGGGGVVVYKDGEVIKIYFLLILLCEFNL